MPHSELLKVSCYFILIVYTSFSTGFPLLKIFFILTKEKYKFNLPTILGLSTLLGLGILGYCGLVLGLLSKLNKTSILTLSFLLILITFPQTYSFLHTFKKLKIFKLSFITLILGTLLLTAIAIQYLSTMLPPFAWDEIAYHLPQANLVAETGKISFPFGTNHFLYGNIPKLMEIIFAEGIVIAGYPLAHALNFAVLLGLILIVLGITTNLWGIKTGLIASLLIATYYDLHWVSTTGYIDGAATSFEIAGLLIAFIWATNEKALLSLLLISGGLIGISLSVKYTPIFTFLFISILILSRALISNNRKKNILHFILFSLTTFIFSFFWYIKNFVQFQNPIYPFYFGHKGFSNEDYRLFIESVHSYIMPLTIKNFLKIPLQFIQFINVPIFFSLIFLPIALTIKKNTKFLVLSLIYSLSFLGYWFFFATHQIRFLMPAIIVSLICFSVTIFLANLRLKIIFFSISFTVFLIFMPQNFFSKENLKNYFSFYIASRVKYGLGLENEDHFLSKDYNFGCLIPTIRFIDNQKIKGNVIDNWTLPYNNGANYYSRNHLFQPYQKTFLSKEIFNENNFKYLYINKSTRGKVGTNIDQKIALEDNIISKSKLVFSNRDCNLYRINNGEINTN